MDQRRQDRREVDKAFNPELIAFWLWGMVKNDVIWEMSVYVFALSPEPCALRPFYKGEEENEEILLVDLSGHDCLPSGSLSVSTSTK